MKQIGVILWAILSLGFMLTGCAPELNERLIIRAVGIDLTDTGYLVTVRSAQDSESEISYAAEGSTVVAALGKIRQQTGKELLYSHNEAIVFSMKCAENDLQRAVDFFLRHYDSCPTVKVFLAENSAEEILALDGNATEYVKAEEIAGLAKSAGAVDADLTSLINGVYGSNQSAVMPVLGNTIEVCGAGMVQAMRLSTVLGEEPLKGYSLLCGKKFDAVTTLYDETCGVVSIQADGVRSKIQFTGTKDEPKFTVDIDVVGDIGSISTDHMQLDSGVFTDLERAYSTALLQNATEYLDSALFLNGCDAAGFGIALRRDSAETWKRVHEDLNVFLQNATIEVNVTAKINRVEEEDKPYF